MSFFTIFALSTIPGGISTVIVMFLHKDVNSIMKKENPNYSGNINNTFDLFRIMTTYKKSTKLSKSEKQILRITLVLTAITWITGITWIVILIFFPDKVLD